MLLQLYFHRLVIKSQFRKRFHVVAPLATDTRKEILPNFILEFLLLSLKPQHTNLPEVILPCNEGGITSGRMGASLCRGEKELFKIFLLLAGKEFQLQQKGREAACRDCTIPWQETGAPGVTGSTFLTVM